MPAFKPSPEETPSAAESLPTLDQVKPGYGGVIAFIGGEGALRRRLLDMGLTPKTMVTVRKVAPMGDPIEIFLRSYVLTIRKEEAAKIQLKEVIRTQGGR